MKIAYYGNVEKKKKKIIGMIDIVRKEKCFIIGME